MPTRILRYILLFCALFVAQFAPAQSLQDIKYPAMFEATTDVNIREKPYVGARKVGLLTQGDVVNIQNVLPYGDTKWGSIVVNDNTYGFVCMEYLRYYKESYTGDVKKESTESTFSDTLSDIWDTATTWFRYAVIIAIVLVVLAFKDLIGAIIGTYIIAAIIGAVIGLFLGNAERGASIACWLVTIVGGFYVISNYGGWVKVALLIVAVIPFIPLYLCNQLQWVLIAPWRWLFKSDWLSEEAKQVARPICTTLSLIITIAITPLRIFNSIIYNSIHFCYDFYNYILEVIMPSAEDEGAEDAWSWCLHFIKRVFKYPLCHGLRSLWDSALGILVDTFVPTLTLYHGTTETAANNILSDNNRNSYQQWHTNFLRGTFKASSKPNCTWAGLGVYFAKSIFLAVSYATSERNSDGSDSVLIVSRVSYGLLISYNLAPWTVSYNTGQYGKHTEINKWAMAEGYTTGEWWNGYNWEYCLFDWQNRYNHPWRIRPIYAFNLSTLFFHRIKGGMQHWEIGEEKANLS